MTHKTAEQILAEPNGYSNFVKALFNRSGDLSKDFAHAAVGLVTEVHELRRATDLVNQIEEAGDMLFYGEAMRQVIGDALGYQVGTKMIAPEFQRLLTQTELTSDEGCTNSLNDLLDHAKRWIGYGKRPENLIAVLAEASAVITLEILAASCGEVIDKVELTNVKKLLKRYNGMTFSKEAAVNRDLGAERAVLEDAAAA